MHSRKFYGYSTFVQNLGKSTQFVFFIPYLSDQLSHVLPGHLSIHCGELDFARRGQRIRHVRIERQEDLQSGKKQEFRKFQTNPTLFTL